MLEKFFPAHPILGVSSEHFSDELFAHIGDIVDSSRKIKVFFVDHDLELIDVLSVIWWSESHLIIPSEEHPVVTNTQGVHVSLIAVL